MTFGERLKQARALSNLSQQELADRIGINKMSISKYETGKMMPSSSTLIALSRALNVSLDYFFAEVNVKLKAKPEFRLDGTSRILKDQTAVKITAQTEEAVSRHREVLEIYPDEQIADVNPDLKARVKDMTDIENLAIRIRQNWELGLDPIENLIDAAENHGFTIVLIEGDTKFDAAVFIEEEYGPIIALKHKTPKERQRFSLAHELGHYFIQCSAPATPTWNDETRSNRFAAALLIPRAVLMADVGRKRTSFEKDELLMLREKYGVSISMLLNRMKSLDIISEDVYERYKHLDAKGEYKVRRSETGKHEEPRLIRKLVYRAVAEGVISEQRGFELLGEEGGVSSRMGRVA